MRVMDRLVEGGKGVAKRGLQTVFGAAMHRSASARPERWGLATVGDGDGRQRLSLHGHDLRSLSLKCGSPLIVVDGPRLDAAAAAALAPGAGGRGGDIFYSYKTNPVPAVLARLHRAGIGAEVISEYELWLAIELGVPGERIVYNGPAKSASSLAQAVRHGVALVNANSLGDMRALSAAARDAGVRARAGVRVAVPGGWGGQFGIAAGSEQLLTAVREAAADPALELLGLHVHRGGTMRTAGDFEAHITDVLELCDRLTASTGWSPTIIDVGGGLACPTSAAVGHRQFRINRAVGRPLTAPDPEEALSVPAASELAWSRIDAHHRRLGRPTPRVVLEPGRALTADTQILLLSIHDVKDDVDPVHLVLDGGRNIAEPLPLEFHQLFCVDHPQADPARRYRLVGPICTPADVLYNDVALPEMAVGDVVAVMDAGAYFVPFSTSFSFGRPPIVMVDPDTVSVVRDRESFSDLARLDAVDAEAGMFNRDVS